MSDGRWCKGSSSNAMCSLSGLLHMEISPASRNRHQLWGRPYNHELFSGIALAKHVLDILGSCSLDPSVGTSKPLPTEAKSKHTPYQKISGSSASVWGLRVEGENGR